MEKRLKHEGIIRDDKAVALTEFAIVMPVLLLLFLAILQYLEFDRAAQMVNYATYVSARSYAVLHSQEYATDAAALALAPISKNPPLPITGIISSGDILKLSAFMAGIAQVAQAPYGMHNYPFTTAMRVWSASQSLEWNFNISTSTVDGGNGLTQVDVSLNYPQVINIPGFAGLWNLLAGNNPFHTFTAETLPLDQGVVPEYELFASFGTAEGYYSYGCVSIPSKCSTGYESWGSTTNFTQAYNQVSGYNTIYPASSWWKGTSGSWQPRTAAQPQ